MSVVGGVSDMQGHGVFGEGLHVAPDFTVRLINRVALLAQGEVDRCLCEGQVAFRRADEPERFQGGDGKGEGMGVGVSYIFRCETDHPSQDIKRVFPAFQHPREPIERGVGVGAPHALMEGAYQVVVHLALLVIDRNIPLVRLP